MIAEKPNCLSELLSLMQSDKTLIFVAGGTDLTLHLRHKIREDHYIVDLTGLDNMKGIHETDTEIFIGALWTMTEMEKSPWFIKHTPCLSKAAAAVGSTQIRNRATLGGNVANAAQCADTIPALMVLDAHVEILCLDGSVRRVPLTDFVEGIGLTALKNKEVITGFWIPKDVLEDTSAYAKVGSREAVTIAKINCALRIKMDHGVVTSASIALGSLGSKAFMSEGIAKALQGCIEEELLSEGILDSFVKQVEAAIPGRESLSYKRSAVKGVADSVLRQCIDLMRGNKS
jgi:carbon-monoxide dehydrogenase medium subunit